MVQYEISAYHNYAEMAPCVASIKAKCKRSIYSVRKHGMWRWNINDVDNEKWVCRIVTSRNFRFRFIVIVGMPRLIKVVPRSSWSRHDDGSKNVSARGLGGSACVRSQDATHSVWGGGLQKGEWTYVRTSSRHVYSTTSTQWYRVWDHQFTRSRVWRISSEMSFR